MAKRLSVLELGRKQGNVITEMGSPARMGRELCGVSPVPLPSCGGRDSLWGLWSETWQQWGVGQVSWSLCTAQQARGLISPRHARAFPWGSSPQRAPILLHQCSVLGRACPQAACSMPLSVHGGSALSSSSPAPRQHPSSDTLILPLPQPQPQPPRLPPARAQQHRAEGCNAAPFLLIDTFSLPSQALDAYF